MNIEGGDGGPEAARARPHASSPAGCTGTCARTAARRLSAVLRARRRLPRLGRRRPALCRFHVQLGTDHSRPQTPARQRGRAAADGRRRLPQRAHRAHGRAGRAARRSGPARRLGAVLQERHRRHDDLRHARARRHGQAENPRREGRLSWRRPLVHAASARRDGGRSRPSDRIRLQRHRQPRSGRREGGRRSRRRDRLGVPPRLWLRPGTAGRGLRQARARTVRREAARR